MQCSVGTPWVCTFMWMPLDPSKHCLVLFGVCCLSSIHDGGTSQHTGPKTTNTVVLDTREQPRRSCDHALTDQNCFVCTRRICTILSRLVLILCMIITSFLLRTLYSLLLVSAYTSRHTGIRSRVWRRCLVSVPVSVCSDANTKVN